MAAAEACALSRHFHSFPRSRREYSFRTTSATFLLYTPPPPLGSREAISASKYPSSR